MSITEAVIVKTFTESMDFLDNTMERLILESHTQMKHLVDLEAHLDLLSELVSREDVDISAGRDEVLTSLWTVLGGNRALVRKYERGLALLSALSGYRKAALMHVISALQTLQELRGDLEVLRQSVASPALLGSSIPVEVQIESIQSGLLRLRESGARAKVSERHARDKLLVAK